MSRIALVLAPRLARGLILALRVSMKWTQVNKESVLGLHRAGRPYVHAFYHDQLLMMTYSYLGQARGRRLAVLSSRHRDGEYVSRTLERFGHTMIRGSTGRGGVGGLRELIRHLRAGEDVAIAVDGPRGPRHLVSPGVIETARLGRAPIVPVAFAASRVATFRSWDRFQVPWPFAHGVFVYGDPVQVPTESGRVSMEKARSDLQGRLDDLTRRAIAMARGRNETTDILQSRRDSGTRSTGNGRS